jgi:SnoaL-like domain
VTVDSVDSADQAGEDHSMSQRTTDTSPGVRRLDDRAEITEVLAHYARGLDDRDFESVGRCFTADAQATFSGVVLAPGRNAIVAHVSALSSLAASTHLLGLPVIDLSTDGLGAIVETTAVAYLVADADIGPVRTRGLRYRDVFVRLSEREAALSGARWQIRERVHRVDWMVEQPATPLPR